ncbi:hypothetical protein BsWGS_10489 [Bradybaena similaris]
MKNNVYHISDIDSSCPPVSYYQSTASSHDATAHKGEHEANLNKALDVKTDSKSQLVTDDKDENTYLKRNKGSHVPNSVSQTVPEYPFSLARVWIAITVIVVVNIVVVAVIAPLLSQYLFEYFLEESMKFVSVNMTMNSTNASASSCKDTTDSENDAINAIQKQASNIYLYANIVTNIPAFFVCLFAGSISDFLGRKCPLICSVLGLIIKTAILCIVIKLKLDVQLIYIGAAVEGIMGSYFTTTMAVTAIITDITQDETTKAVRFAVIEGLILVFGALTQVAVGYLIERTGFFIPVLMCDCILVIPLLAIIFLLPETLPQKGAFSWNILSHVKKTFGFYFSKVGGNRRRLKFIAGLGAYFTVIFTLTGKVTIEIFYVLTRPICWTSVDIGIFNSVRMIVMSVAGVIMLRLCRGRISLELTGVICGISSIGGFVFFGFTDSTLLVYLSALVGILYMASVITPRAVLSQQASPGEQGALFSSLACTEAVASMASSTVYILIYNATLDTFKGATFMVIAGMSLFYTMLHGIMTLLRTPKQVDNENHTEGHVDGRTDVCSNGDKSSKL